ncbi:hypothetical protein Ahy_B01g055358 [Arachis hypogaea]|uniref:PB1-like domain-containing protein n=1 Tax=Arachis hypogaea TaxID=3818 RepID=A0A445AW25_ARAHY|nr:hypothetical protein Ahy_B01g055358 [Arachis hypogaea]
MDVLLDIMFHHGGNSEKDDEGKLRYTPDNLTCLGDLDEDTLDVFFIRNYYKELGYDKILHCWWLVPERTLETGLRNLNSDNELREMCFLAHKNNGLVDVYFKHGVSSPDYLQDEEKKAAMENIGVVVAEEEGAMVTPNDKTRNPSSESPQNKPTPVNTIEIPNPPINLTPPTKPTPPSMPESVTNPTQASQEKSLANSNDQSQAKPKSPTNPQSEPPTSQKPKPPTNPQLKPPTNQKPKPPTTSKSKPPTKPILPKSVSIATSNSTLKSNLKKKTTTTTHNFRPCTRSVAKGKAVLQARQEGESLKPQPPKVKRGPGKLQQKRRMDTDEAKGGHKKSKPTSTKDSTNLKRQLAPFTCSYCGEKDHTKRGCKKKKLADAAAAEAATAAKAKTAAKKTSGAEVNVVEDGSNAADPDPTPQPDRNVADDANVGKDAPADSINTNVQPVEVELSQPIYSEPEESQQAAEVCTITNSRPDKLPPKRKSSISPTSVNAPINPMQGASSGTATRLGSILKFIPTPGFKAPRKKD